LKAPETYRCLTCGRQRLESKGAGEKTFECEACGGAAFLVGTLDPPPVEVHLRRMRVEEAMFKLDRYLNTAFLAGLPQVRIVHGKGTGKVRKAVLETIAGHPLVGSFREATPEEGGWGVTVAILALD